MHAGSDAKPARLSAEPAPRTSDGGDQATADAFATSWNDQRAPSVYTRAQFEDWFRPIEPAALAGQSVLELGFGNGSLLYHVATCCPSRLVGVELGDTLARTRDNLAHLPAGMLRRLELHRGDLTTVDVGTDEAGFDYVYCIGVLHHLEVPEAGFRAMLRHTRPGGHFHGWVYAEEGNAVVIRLVDPLRRIVSRLPWWVTKYGVAMPLAVPFFAYARVLRHVPRELGDHLPLGAYGRWLGEREFAFAHHVAFDQLVTPQTTYLARSTIEAWLRHPDVDPASTYVHRRNGNSWKFGGRRRAT